jgi:transcriptional regulator with XRE-family HTH domain
MRPKAKGKKESSDYERLLAQERLILDATETIIGLLEEQAVSRQELARRIGRTKSYVSQILSGDRNMTLRTLAELGYVLGQEFSVESGMRPLGSTNTPDIGLVASVKDDPSPVSSAESHEYALAV